MVPEVVIYLGIMLAVICLWFLLFKRPIYEGVAISFVVLVLITGTWVHIGDFFLNAIGIILGYSGWRMVQFCRRKKKH